MKREDARVHFTRRVKKYDHSSNWVRDRRLIQQIFDLANPKTESHVLDLATGTCLIASAFYKKVEKVTGIDICPEMTRNALTCMDSFVQAPAEKLPFKARSFDICVCRQGLQFMQLDKALEQIYRVLKPEGTVVFCHLTAYGEDDKETTFHIQQLRNPARKNFFTPADIHELLKKHQFIHVEEIEYITRESVNRWIHHGAIEPARMKSIIDAYRHAPDGFKRIHKVIFENGDIYDNMMMLLVKAGKEQ